MSPSFADAGKRRPSISRPSQTSNWRGIESLAEAEQRNEQLIERLYSSLPDVARAIKRCDPERGRACGQLACAVCARSHRLWLTGQLRDLVAKYEGPHAVVTALLASLDRGCLQEADIDRRHEKFRQRLNRAGFKDTILVGGTEAAWQNERWLVHVHLLAIGVERTKWDRLRAHWPAVGERVPIRVDQFKDPERQLSYLQKFVTYHRPGARGLDGRGRAYPLPSPQLVELVGWWSKHRFADFLFAFGARRRGSHIVDE